MDGDSAAPLISKNRFRIFSSDSDSEFEGAVWVCRALEDAVDRGRLAVPVSRQVFEGEEAPIHGRRPKRLRIQMRESQKSTVPVSLVGALDADLEAKLETEGSVPTTVAVLVITDAAQPAAREGGSDSETDTISVGGTAVGEAEISEIVVESQVRLKFAEDLRKLCKFGLGGFEAHFHRQSLRDEVSPNRQERKHSGWR